jgi:hypothetical protein
MPVRLDESIMKARTRRNPIVPVAKTVQAVFPIMALKYDTNDRRGPVTGDPKVQGSVTLLTSDGLFVTAAHCLAFAYGDKDIVGQNEFRPGDYSLVIPGGRDGQPFLLPVSEVCHHPVYDVAVGLAPPHGHFPMRLGIGTSTLAPGASVLGLGYPETEVMESPELLKTSITTRHYRGEIEAWGLKVVPTWRRDVSLADRSDQRAPGYTHSSTTPHGMSGGPLICTRTNRVHAVMCGSLSTLGGANFALDTAAFVDGWSIPFLGNKTLREYARDNPSALDARGNGLRS